MRETEAFASLAGGSPGVEVAVPLGTTCWLAPRISRAGCEVDRGVP